MNIFTYQGIVLGEKFSFMKTNLKKKLDSYTTELTGIIDIQNAACQKLEAIYSETIKFFF